MKCGDSGDHKRRGTIKGFVSQKSELYGNMEGRYVRGWERLGGLVIHRALPRKLWAFLVPVWMEQEAVGRGKNQATLVLGHSVSPSSCSMEQWP